MEEKEKEEEEGYHMWCLKKTVEVFIALSWAVLKLFGAPVTQFWGPSWPFWTLLGRLGALLGNLGASSGALGGL